MKSSISTLFYIIVFSTKLFSQEDPVVLLSDLRTPVGIDKDEQGNFWIAEQGTGANDGAVSIIWNDGSTQRVIDSIINVFIPAENLIEGPVRVQVIDNYIYVFAPMGPDLSELGIIIFERDKISKNASPLLYKDRVGEIRVNDAAFKNGRVESHPYSFVNDGCDLLIADAAANAIYKKDPLSGIINELVYFPPSPNPLPFGPPLSDAVPTRIIRDPLGGYLVSQLTGFPFLPHSSKVYHVSEQGDLSVKYDNLTLITDMVPSPDGDGVYVLELTEFDSTFNFVLNTSKIIHLKNDGSRDTLANGFGPSPGFCLDNDGNILVTHLFFGMVIKLEKKMTKLNEVQINPFLPMEIFPNPSEDNFNIKIVGKPGNKARVVIYDVLGKLVFSKELEVSENNVIPIEIRGNEMEDLKGLYLVKAIIGNQTSSGLVILK